MDWIRICESDSIQNRVQPDVRPGVKRVRKREGSQVEWRGGLKTEAL